MSSFGTKSKKSLIGIAPKLVQVMEAAIVNSPIDFTITDGVRTAAEQAALFRKGRDAAGNIINRADVVTMRDGIHKKSNHQPKDDGFGYAVDLYPFVNGGIVFDESPAQKTIADHIKTIAAGMNVKIVWGGDWTVARDGLVDRPHFELR